MSAKIYPANVNLNRGPPQPSAMAAWKYSLLASVSTRLRYRRAMRELQQLDEATLRDLRLNRGDFHRIAATYSGLSERYADDDRRVN
jgi:uncharacterized protein YjiS (DUF1127 family)